MTSNDYTPVFVMGSARSGTTLVSQLLSSNSQFATYKAETLLLNVCRIKYGNIFSSKVNQQRFLTDWFRSRQFRESGLSRETFLRVLRESVNYEDLLIRFLSEIAKISNSKYIVDSTPSNAPYLTRLKNTHTGSKFINIIRDGRDVAISQVKLGWSNPPSPYNSEADHLHYAIVQWERTLKVVSKQASKLNILRLKYEDIVTDPNQFENLVKQYLDIGMSSIDTSIIGTYDSANSAFGKLGGASNTSPIGRWRSMNPAEVKELTYGVTKTLMTYGYEAVPHRFNLRLFFRYQLFKLHLALKRTLIKIPKLGRISSVSIEIEQVDDNAHTKKTSL